MKKVTLLAAIAVLGNLAVAEETPEENNTIRLYQVGTKGNYCVSLSKSTSGCVSGVDDDGNPINVLDFAIKQNAGAKFVVFENLSDAPHDMKFTGANAEDMPAQEPGGDAAQKAIKIEDLSTQKMNCSFHGDMLGVGYRVPTVITETVDNEPGHRERGEGAADTAGSKVADPGPSRPITATGLSDVGKEIMKKGRPGEVEKLIGARPELIKDLQDSRPLLAKDLLAKSPALANGALKLGVATVAKPGEGDFFGKKPGTQIAGAGPNVLGKPVARGAVGGGSGVALTEGGIPSNVQGFIGARDLASSDDDWDLEDEGNGETRAHGTDLKEENRAVRTAAVGSEVSDRTRLKVVRRGGGWQEGTNNRDIWLGLIVVAAATVGGYRFFIAGRKKREERNKA